MKHNDGFFVLKGVSISCIILGVGGILYHFCGGGSGRNNAFETKIRGVLPRGSYLLRGERLCSVGCLRWNLTDAYGIILKFSDREIWYGFEKLRHNCKADAFELLSSGYIAVRELHNGFFGESYWKTCYLDPSQTFDAIVLWKGRLFFIKSTDDWESVFAPPPSPSKGFTGLPGFCEKKNE